MWLDKFFVNLCILVACLFFLHQLLKDRKVTPHSPLPLRFVIGGVLGLLGWLLMMHSLHVGDGTVFDLRILPVFIAAAAGGWVSALTTAVIVGAGRALLFDWTPATVAALSNLFVTAVICGVIVRYTENHICRWAAMSLVNIVAVGISILFIPGDLHVHMKFLLQYALVVSVAMWFTFLLIGYLYRSHEAFLQVRESARKDFLTGLNNVRSFDSAINTLLQKNQEHGEELAFLLIDIDYFKKVNDTYGHSAGDEVLRQLSDVLSLTARSMDVVSRNGGEEFSLILPACSKHNALRVANRIRTTIEHHRFKLPSGQDIQVTVSLGLSQSTPEVPLTAYELVDLADEGLYLAKRSGRNRVCCFQPTDM
ncbi:GGDEF domain-containing protein [Tumebacillus permanentifrigoris]|uniref:Diguanylate cyclase n=1 Tax=Tumebacillus permanentifrigoris TaxID=378543 RepID=A0A316DAW7_9BACL|nr:GGDEF domain-containing protein [Tumebacillus permanentifrigoris]PWK10302.1 diguanylate cyclase [Tumebacillus permanentifrigoris]